MIQFNSKTPELMPDLSPGKHRNPRRGACFMEFASYLAGEKWSDHPKCTHPLLAAVARLVNDFTSDEARGRLVPLIPRVIGLNSSSPALDLRVVVLAASAAIGVASLERQRALAVGLISCARLIDPADVGLMRELEGALDQAPDSERWAREFITEHGLGSEKSALHRGSEAMIRLAVLGIAFACVPDTDERLYNLLERLIVEFEGTKPAPVEAVREFATV